MKRLSKLVILFTLLFLFGCKKDNRDSVPPEITFLDAIVSDTSISSTVRFEFFDDDGDLGLKEKEIKGEQEFNVFVDYFEKENGAWILKSPIITFNVNTGEFDSIPLHFRFPFIENETGGELEGEITVDLDYNPVADTFRYELYIVDRAFQESNKIVTSDLIAN